MTSMLLDLTAEARQLRPSIGDIEPALREAARRTWLGRMINEHGSAPVFDGLARQLEAAGVAADLVAECRTMAEEERTHGALCGAVVEALGGEARAEVDTPRPLPEHRDVAPLEGVLRNVLSVCCLSETVAVAQIDAERLEMPEGELRELLTRILADEVGHARFGWRFLGSVVPALDAAARARLATYLRVAFASLEQHELSRIPARTTFPPGAASYGLCDGAAARGLFYATVHEVIVPRLEQHGLPARAAWEARRSRRAA
ncbi:ferritin-like domain-containing protein [Polyangium sp. y55x31]|uniref:ferritin-like domain-containing protein n=1 Tax=Polyangium sp. y55x31 TaxID=3042688 RepID=UPI00248251E5|nr:ferritin-like domain-containing protein [Polyangium sp. y55x31]MDI1480129.1 ferritin-like domain-containing protein [Polyangium sp. y55x31]